MVHHGTLFLLNLREFFCIFDDISFLDLQHVIYFYTKHSSLRSGPLKFT